MWLLSLGKVKKPNNVPAGTGKLNSMSSALGAAGSSVSKSCVGRAVLTRERVSPRRGEPALPSWSPGEDRSRNTGKYVLPHNKIQ